MRSRREELARPPGLHGGHTREVHRESWGRRPELNPPRVDLPNDLVRIVAAHEHNHSREHRRDERGHRLSEHMTQGQQIEESNRTERAGVFPIFLHLAMTGITFARMFLCWMITPFGSAVAPDVNRISAVSSRVTSAAGIASTGVSHARL